MIAAFINSPFNFGAPPAPPPGDPEFVAYGASNGTTYALPTGTASGDFMVAWVGCASNSFSTPSGWTQSVAPALWSASNGYWAACYTKVAGSSEPSSYTFATGSFRIGCILTYRNASAVDATGSIQECGTDTTPDLTGITSSSGSMLLALLFNRTNSLLTITPPTGMTERVDQLTASFFQMTTAELLSADSSTRTFTQSASPFGSGGLLIAIT
jgi:hypothetical protein